MKEAGMGFVHVRRDEDGRPEPGWPKATVRLEHLEPAHDGPFASITWRMLDDLGYEVPDGVVEEDRFVVAPAHPIGSSTDLASVPPWLWGVIASFGRHTLAALLHDHLCEEAERASASDAGRRRRRADHLFRVAMLELGVPAPRAWIMWAAVRLFGEAGRPGPAGKAPAGVVVAATLAWWTTVVAAVAGAAWTGPVALTALAAVLLVAAGAAFRGRGDLAGATLAGALGGVLVAPALAVSLATVLVLDGPPLAGWALRKLASSPPRSPVADPGRPPQVGPMRAL